jgi:hypothetical protein
MQNILVWVTGEPHSVVLFLCLVPKLLLLRRARSDETVEPSDVSRFLLRTRG